MVTPRMAPRLDAHSPDAFRRCARASADLLGGGLHELARPAFGRSALLLVTLGSLAELLSDGKSGSFFYFSNDGRYLIKTGRSA